MGFRASLGECNCGPMPKLIADLEGRTSDQGDQAARRSCWDSGLRVGPKPQT